MLHQWVPQTITSEPPNSRHMAHKAVIGYRDANKWSKMGWDRKLATVLLPPFEVSLILKPYVCVCGFSSIFARTNLSFQSHRLRIYRSPFSPRTVVIFYVFSYCQQISKKDQNQQRVAPSLCIMTFVSSPGAVVPTEDKWLKLAHKYIVLFLKKGSAIP